MRRSICSMVTTPVVVERLVCSMARRYARAMTGLWRPEHDCVTAGNGFQRAGYRDLTNTLHPRHTNEIRLQHVMARRSGGSRLGMACVTVIALMATVATTYPTASTARSAHLPLHVLLTVSASLPSTSRQVLASE